jgi:hypothetical protein
MRPEGLPVCRIGGRKRPVWPLLRPSINSQDQPLTAGLKTARQRPANETRMLSQANYYSLVKNTGSEKRLSALGCQLVCRENSAVVPRRKGRILFG